MRTTAIRLAAVTASFVFLGAAFAQDSSTQGHDMAAMELPEPCRTGDVPDMGGMKGMHSAMPETGERQRAMMQSMMQMRGLMMQGMMAEDPDVAFACAMIPHHVGAIAMAEAVLENGDSAEMKQMARTIIEAQKHEIEVLMQWLGKQAQ